MHNATANRDLEQIISAHTNFGQASAGQLASIAAHIEADRVTSWKRTRQRNFDALGLPRGLAKVGA